VDLWSGILAAAIVLVLGVALVQLTSRRPAPKSAPAKAPSKRPPPTTPSPEAQVEIPSFVDSPVEDPEITVITASPSTDADDEDGGTGGGPSRVEVIYESDAADEEVTSPGARILVSAWGQSDRGIVRKKNEDSLLVLPEHSVFAVCDGMGGYSGGEVASALAVETLKRAFERSVFEGRTDAPSAVPRRGLELARAVQMANQAIFERAKTDPALSQMGTTLVAARFSPNKQRVYIGHVGDSRCYRLRNGVMRRLTTDHTMAHLGMKGAGAHHLFQAVGVKPQIQIDLIVDKPKADDIYLLCSDGLSKMATDDEIVAIVREAVLEACVHRLIGLANEHGGKDNVTAVLVKVVERPGSSTTTAGSGAPPAHPRAKA
jgi:serine/threonine protein phosphatase PrpC